MVRYAVIFEDPRADQADERFRSGYRIAGGRLKVEKGHTVRLFNLTNSEAQVTFTRDLLFEEESFTLPPGGWKEKVDIEPGWYPYRVLINGQEATASRPIVIGYP